MSGRRECEGCGAELAEQSGGRPRRWCSDACRKRKRHSTDAAQATRPLSREGELYAAALELYGGRDGLEAEIEKHRGLIRSVTASVPRPRWIGLEELRGFALQGATEALGTYGRRGAHLTAFIRTAVRSRVKDGIRSLRVGGPPKDSPYTQVPVSFQHAQEPEDAEAFAEAAAAGISQKKLLRALRVHASSFEAAVIAKVDRERAIASIPDPVTKLITQIAFVIANADKEPIDELLAANPSPPGGPTPREMAKFLYRGHVGFVLEDLFRDYFEPAETRARLRGGCDQVRAYVSGKSRFQAQTEGRAH
jgi:hypothetical protein